MANPTCQYFKVKFTCSSVPTFPLCDKKRSFSHVFVRYIGTALQPGPGTDAVKHFNTYTRKIPKDYLSPETGTFCQLDPNSSMEVSLSHKEEISVFTVLHMHSHFHLKLQIDYFKRCMK